MAIQFLAPKDDSTKPSKKTIAAHVNAAIKAGIPCPHSDHKYLVVIDPRLIAVDTDYQTKDRLDHNAGLSPAVWDWDMYEPIRVSYRDGYLFVFEGSHRTNVALQMNCTEIDAVLYTDLTQQREIELFIHQNDNKAKLSPAEKFYAQLNGNNPNPIIADIHDLLLKYGYCVPNKSLNRALKRIKATSLMVELYTAEYSNDFQRGHESLEWYLETLRKIDWYLQPKATNEEFMAAFHAVWTKHMQLDDLPVATSRVNKILTFLGTEAIRHEADRHFLRKGNIRRRIENMLLAISDGEYKLVPNASYIDPTSTPDVDEYTIESINPAYSGPDFPDGEE